MSPEANQAAGGESPAEAGANKAPSAEQIAAEQKAEEAALKAAKAERDRAAAKAEEEAEDATASASNPVPEPKEAEEPPHPAIAELEGPAASMGHVIDVTDANLDALPLGPCAVDDHGRVWKYRERKVEVIEEREGDEKPVPHEERRREIVFVGRLQR